jgi:hypothetical protein
MRLKTKQQQSHPRQGDTIEQCGTQSRCRPKTLSVRIDTNPEELY